MVDTAILHFIHVLGISRGNRIEESHVFIGFESTNIYKRNKTKILKLFPDV